MTALLTRTIGLLLGSSIVTSSAASAQPYVVVDLGEPPVTYSQTLQRGLVPLAISENDQVIGFIPGWRDVVLSLPRADYELDPGLHNFGTIADRFPQALLNTATANFRWLGTYDFEGGPNDGRHLGGIWTGGNTVEVVPTLDGGTHGTGMDMTEAGVVVGASEFEEEGKPRPVAGYRWSQAGGIVQLSLLGGFDSCRADGINEHGEIVGTAFHNAVVNEHVPEFKQAANTLGLLKYANFAAIARDNTAVIWRNDQAIDLNTLVVGSFRPALLTARDISNRRRIIGTYEHHVSGKIRAYMLVPAYGDFNGDGEVTEADMADFLGAFFAQDPTTDYTRDGTIGNDDLEVFSNYYLNGVGIGGVVEAVPTAVEADRWQRELLIHKLLEKLPGQEIGTAPGNAKQRRPSR